MPVFQVDTEKALNGRNWSNRYLMIADTIESARVMSGEIIDAERTVTASQVTFTKWRVSAFGIDSPQYIVTPLNLPGLRVVTDMLPLFNVVRVDIFAGAYAPGRKYLHGCLGEQDQSSGLLTQTAIDFFQTSYADIIVGVTTLIVGSGLPPDGQRAIESASVFREVGMRQLKRGSKRKTAPIITP